MLRRFMALSMHPVSACHSDAMLGRDCRPVNEFADFAKGEVLSRSAQVLRNVEKILIAKPKCDQKLNSLH